MIAYLRDQLDFPPPYALKYFPPFQFLALQDLMLLSQYSPVRRQEVFSLSQPGITKINLW